MNSFYDPHLVNGDEAVAFGVSLDASNTLPVEVSREALEDHFGASPKGGASLLGAYVRYRDEIDARARAKRIESRAYTREDPLKLGTADF